jgi:hypothetical protein
MSKTPIKHKGEIIAYVFRKKLKANGTKFLTPDETTLQVGLLEHPSGAEIKAHLHPRKKKQDITISEEFLFVEKGQIMVRLFSEDWKPVKKVILSKGDSILMLKGGHGVKVLKKCRVVEVKQGPFLGNKTTKVYKDSS